MNNYERRKRASTLKRRESYQAQRFDMDLKINKAIQDFEDAWFDLHGCRASVKYKHGRYYVHNRSYLFIEFIFFTMQLQARKHEQELYGEV